MGFKALVAGIMGLVVAEATRMIDAALEFRS